MTNVTHFIYKVYIGSYSLTYQPICLLLDDIFYAYTSHCLVFVLQLCGENPGTCLGRLRKTMRNFRQDSQPNHLNATLHAFTRSSPSDLPMHVLHINLSRQMYVCLTHTFLSTTTHFISLITICYMFQSY